MDNTPLITKKAVKNRLENQNVGTKAYARLNKKVEQLVDEAGKRAEQNNRKTVKARDF